MHSPPVNLCNWVTWGSLTGIYSKHKEFRMPHKCRISSQMYRFQPKKCVTVCVFTCRTERWSGSLPHLGGHTDRPQSVSDTCLLHRLLPVQLWMLPSATRGVASGNHLQSQDKPVPKSAAEILWGTWHAVVQQCLCVSSCLCIVIHQRNMTCHGTTIPLCIVLSTCCDNQWNMTRAVLLSAHCNWLVKKTCNSSEGIIPV